MYVALTLVTAISTTLLSVGLVVLVLGIAMVTAACFYKNKIISWYVYVPCALSLSLNKQHNLVYFLHNSLLYKHGNGYDTKTIKVASPKKATFRPVQTAGFHLEGTGEAPPPPLPFPRNY